MAIQEMKKKFTVNKWQKKKTSYHTLGSSIAAGFKRGQIQ